MLVAEESAVSNTRGLQFSGLAIGYPRYELKIMNFPLKKSGVLSARLLPLSLIYSQ